MALLPLPHVQSEDVVSKRKQRRILDAAVRRGEMTPAEADRAAMASEYAQAYIKRSKDEDKRYRRHGRDTR